MRQEVLEQLESRIENLKQKAILNSTPDDILLTGLSGSLFRFYDSLRLHTAMTKEEYFSGVYDRWLLERYKQVYQEVNQKPW